MTEPHSIDTSSNGARRAMFAIAVHAHASELAEPIRAAWPDLAVADLRAPESGLVMVRGRIGGDGAPFNLGEATMSRAAVTLPTGEIGHGHVLGRDADRARLIAILDAVWQRPENRDIIERSILAPVRQRLQRERNEAQAKTAATKVDFFTLVRGED